MIVEPASLGETAEVAPESGLYWAKLWRRTSASWSVSEWRVSSAADALEVIEWARQAIRAGDRAEVFAEYAIPGIRADGNVEMRKKHLRVYGSPHTRNPAHSRSHSPASPDDHPQTPTTSTRKSES